MNNEDTLKQLTAPFLPEELHWRIMRRSKDGTKAAVMTYVDSRILEERLDTVLGPGNWNVEYHPIDLGDFNKETRDGAKRESAKGFLATLTMTMPDGTIITRTNGAGVTDIEPVKGGITQAFRRACASVGIGRYLYNLPEVWVPVDQYGKFTVPSLPSWALPEGYTPPARSQGPIQPQTNAANSNTEFVTPDTPIWFGKYSGKTIYQIHEDPQGDGWLAWYLKQPAKDAKSAMMHKIVAEFMEGLKKDEDDLPF